MKTLAMSLLIAGVLSVMPGSASAQTQAEVVAVKFNWRKLPPSTEDSGRKSQQMRLAQIRSMISLERQKDPKDQNHGLIAQLQEEMLRVQRNQVTLDSMSSSNKGYEYKFKFKNLSKKEVAALLWSFVFSDPVSGKELARHRFRSKAHLEPGKERGLTAYTDSGPPWELNAEAANKVGKAWNEVVIIEKIEFADGSNWVRTGS